MKPNDIFNINEAMMAGGSEAYATEGPKNAAPKMGSQERRMAAGAVKGSKDMSATLGLVRGKDGVARLKNTKQEGVAEGEVYDLEKEYGYEKPRAQRRSVDPDSHNPYPYTQQQDDDYFRELFRKQRAAKAKAEREADHERLATGTNEDAEYDDEAGMVDNNLATLERCIQGIDEIVQPGDNLPEWCQEKIAQAKGMLVNVWDYMKSEEENGAMAEDWQKVNRKDKTDGMSSKAVKAYRRENPGSKLKTAVTKKPSELKAGSKDAKRRKSFCARMSGVEGPMKDEKGRPTAKAKALARWNCEEGATPTTDYEAMFESKLNEFASCGGTGGIATALPAPSAKAGSLFGGSYSQPNSPFKKTAKKRTGKMIKR